MKKFLALALVGLMATSANALTVSLVARSGPNAYTGGVPSALNGGAVGVANLGLPSVTGLGLTVPVSGTARLGIVVELFNGTNGSTGAPNGNQISTATVFLGNTGALGAVDLADVESTAVNRFGNLWNTSSYSTGMSHWINSRTGAVGGDLTGDGPAPFIEDFHQINTDDIPAGGQGGNAWNAPNSTFLLTDIIVHGVGPVGSVARVTFGSGEGMEFFTEESEQYGFAGANAAPGPLSNHGDAGTGPGGTWFARNGRNPNTAFPIEVIIPEPASLALLGFGALAVLRKRTK